MSTPLSKEEAFARLGSITREMHEALSVLGANQLHNIVEEIPNARDRLAYVGKMTEDAANKVLNLVEEAKPACDDLAKRGDELGAALTRLAQSADYSDEKAKGLLVTCGKFAHSTAQFSSKQAEVLSDIMMAQDFQDLSGQVIKKVIDIITRTEMQLVQLLIDSSPEAVVSTKAAATEGTVSVDDHVLEGPQTADNALKQDDVDDLLASLGF
ncbi:protein phosphatase CheZ [Comamonadaceae bacterium OS-4]|jgi:chemotaxis protein CheZ|uniref:Protein phosphatase CheZ n=1 Tax=Rhodoferax potami TaxID=3068338 RepID=A0ABU3KHH9_9BURK|nr:MULTISPECIES: protein phosphatase CheZ [unclassified Rhodoferax]MDT7517171.1 protein phosphatase CheZ [Rhodoferax sp. TBRC 17660]MDT7522013.1 protein phosphatase CheZ [Rhodoferax sp. TBRC 17198]BDT72312.1 protein phosphatase CheZ [Comamonadaceae bacterium OS-4]